MIKLQNRLNNLNEVNILLNLQDVSVDIVTSLCGKKIGSGSTRTVYEYNLKPKKMVVKIEPMNTDNNYQEYLIWNAVRYLTKDLAWVKDWFAPIHYCSPNNKILIMERTYQTNKPKPTQIPKFLTDIHEKNFGWIGNKFVCHDYGFIFPFVKYEKKFQEVNW